MISGASAPTLPILLAEIAEVVGEPAALAIAKAKGGQRVVIPTRIGADHWLIAAIGAEAAKALSQHFTSGYRRQELDIPIGPGGSIANAAARRRQIVLDAHLAGKSVNEIAGLAGITGRSVHRQLAKIRRAEKRASQFKKAL